MNASITSAPNTHVALLNGEAVECNTTTFREVCDGLIARHPGHGIPTFSAIMPAAPAAAPVPTVPSSPFTTTAAGTPGGQVDEAGRDRAQRDEATARANGFNPAPPVYALGTRVNELGVENARRSQLDHQAKPTAIELAHQLRARVEAEERFDLDPASMTQHLQHHASGDLVVRGQRYAVAEDAYTRLVNRAIPARAVGGYLSDCPPVIRAANFNRWTQELAARGDKKTHVLRTRLNRGEREVFAAVSEKYTAFDADKVASALIQSLPQDARGSLDYDGNRYRLEGMWHTDVAANEFVAGEIFKAGVIVRSADDGSGSVRVQSVIWRNLCLNLIILDESIGVDVRLRHMGGVDKLADAFTTAFEQSLKSVAGFRVAWGSAMEECGDNLRDRTAGTTSTNIVGMKASDFLAGLFNGIVQRDLVPVRGRDRTAVVNTLVQMHQQDEAASAYGISRASVVNAFTRYAHKVEADPWQADAIREGAGRLLAVQGRSKMPEPLPFVEFPML